MDRTASLFVARTFKPDDRIALVLIDRSSTSNTRQILQRARHFDGLMPMLEKANEQSNIYVAINPLTEEARGRTKADISQVRHVFADFDVEAKERIAAMNRSGRMPRPNEIVATSPGKAQVLWRVEGFSKDQAEALSRGLVREYGADPAATDVNRVMRVPGFVNRKYDPAPYVGVQRVHSGISRPDQFPVYESDRQQGSVRGYERTQRTPGGITQSDRDWAYVRDGLKRGVAPSELRARLEETRKDKPNPRYYAEHTVQRAMESRGR